MAKNEKIILESIAAEIRESNIQELMNSDYLPYAFYTIQERALVSEDGMKPVQERILLSLWNNGVKSNKPTMKAGTIYTHVMGNYHPHGQASITDAGAKFGQTYNFRVPIIDVQGSVGFEFGDTPSSDRYYEIRLNSAGEELISDIDNHAVELTRNFTDSEDMPVQLPTKWPFALINGGEGIAVGYSSYLVPHNPTEVMDAVINRMKGKIKSVDGLLKVMKGPDMPTGGELLGMDGVKNYFETGSGRFFIRGKYEIEKLPRGRHKIKFYEIPYKVSSSKIILAINKAKDKGKLKGITEAKNLSSKSRGTDLSIWVKAGENPEQVVTELFKETPLETAYNVSNTILINKKPVVAPIIDILDSFIEFKREIFIRKSTYKLEKLKKEHTRLSGLIKVLVDIDKVISIIRNADNDEIASQQLQKKFKINEEQSSFILQLRLKSLTKADKNELALKVENLKKEIEELETILTDENYLVKAIIKELESTKKIVADDRRTAITEITTEELVEQQKLQQKQERMLSKDVDCYIYLFANGTVMKTLEPLKDYYIPIKTEFKTTSQADFGVVLTDGTVRTVNSENITLNQTSPVDLLTGRQGDLIGLIPLQLSEETYKGILFVTSNGGVNIVKGKVKEPLIKLSDESLLLVKPLTTEDYTKNLYIIAEDGMLAKFPITTIRESNSGAGTVAGMKYKLPAIAAQISDDSAHVLTLSEKTIKITEADIIPSTSRSVKGSMLHKLGKDDRIVDMFIATHIKSVNSDSSNLELPEPTERAKKGSPTEDKLFIGY